MIPRDFEYYAPKSIPDALELLKQFGDEAKLLAGGHSLLPMMKMRFAQPGHLIDLGKISELKGIREEGGTIRIGAMTTENELIWSKLLQTKCPLLVEGARLISDPQVRYKGTIGGDISHGDPGNDHPDHAGLGRVLRAAFGGGRTHRRGGRIFRRHLRYANEVRRNNDRDSRSRPCTRHRLLLRQAQA